MYLLSTLVFVVVIDIVFATAFVFAVAFV